MTTCLLKEESNNIASVWVTVNTTNVTGTPNDSTLVEVVSLCNSKLLILKIKFVI